MAGICTSSNDYILAVVPSAPTAESPGIHVPEFSLLFPIQPTSMPAHATPSLVANDNDNILSKLRDLELKLETAELLRKQDVEKAESLRKKDAEMAESLRKKDAEMAESLRRKDAEKAELLRKKDTERVEVLRKKDRAEVAELENKITHLEHSAIEKEMEWKRTQESTQQYIESLASDIDATTDFLAIGVRLFSFPFLSG